jgi:hypothetical protein
VIAVEWSPEALAYFAEHAVDPDVAALAGVTETTVGLVFPTVDADAFAAPRVRRLRGDGPKVAGPRAVRPGVWWPIGAPLGGTGVVVVTEGESDALAVWSAAWRSSGRTAEVLAKELAGVASIPGTSFPADRLVSAVASADVTDVVLALDGDDPGRKSTARLAEALAGSGVRVAVLELKDGHDLADELARSDDASGWLANALLDAAPLEPSPGDAPELEVDRFGGRRYDLAELIAAVDQEPPWRVEPIAADGHLTLLAAAGGEGKTWASLAFAGGVAHGGTIAGLRCALGRAVIFDAENGQYVLGSSLGTLNPDLPADRVAIYDAEGLRLSDARDRAWVLEVIQREAANLVVLDSLRALAPDAAENDSDDMAPIVNGARTLARERSRRCPVDPSWAWQRGLPRLDGHPGRRRSPVRA